MKRKRLYVGCALTLAPERFKERVENLKKILRDEWEVLDFLGIKNGTPLDVYNKDIVENVGTCDVLLVIADEPSIGLGYEIAIATEKHKKPVLAVAHKNSKVTRMLIGAAEAHNNLNFVQYENLEKEIPILLKEYIR